MKRKARIVLSGIIVVMASVCSVTYGSRSQHEIEIGNLIDALGQRDWQTVVDALAEIGEPAVGPLIRTLNDKSIKTWVVHVGAINALAKIGTQQAAGAVTECVKDKRLNEYVRGSAALAVAELKSENVVKVLALALKDESQFVRWKSAQALGRLGCEEGVEALVLALKDQDQDVHAAAARSLGEIESEDAADGLVRALRDEHWLVRLNARSALLQVGQSTIERLIAALNDENPQTRWQAAWLLGRLKSEQAVEPLVKALRDSDWMVRDEAAVALVRINSNKAVEPLTKGLKHKIDYVRQEATWVLSKMKSDRTVEESESQGPSRSKDDVSQISHGQRTYSCYPQTLDSAPDMPSPYTTENGIEIVTAFTNDGKFALIPVTVENGESLNYRQRQWGKGQQLRVDAADFPALAMTGLHSEAELDETKTITGRSIVEITELGRPGRSSGAGFMSHDEDIVSVLKGDNRLVKKLGLTHPQLARPLFHVWNMILKDIELQRLGRFWENFEHILYNGKKVSVKAEGTKGWQESIFDDEILGTYQFEISRQLDADEKALLREKYPNLTEDQMAELVKKLSYVHAGEMVPYYIMRYGFYEGHTDYRADPIAIAFIFGLKGLKEIEAAFEGKLYEALTQHFTRATAGWR